jgi:Ran GTPase-activating protein (RanGAP) involved in mRNA processing and transport
MENKVTFSSSDLPQGSNTLSLLQAIESFLQSGKSVFYNFIHLSFQELLAGYYIATSLSDSEQVSQFLQLFHQPRFMSVFQFYAAITKLKTSGIDKIISEIISEKLGSKPHLLSLFRCLYEAQDPSLCQSVVNQLESLNISSIRNSLSPMDLLSIGYLIGVSNNDVVKDVFLSGCDIEDYGVKTLMKYLVCTKGTGAWKFDLGMNNIGKEGAASISSVLQSSGVMNSLLLTGNPIGAGGLQSLAEALITNTSLVELNLFGCSLEKTDENGPIVTEMLQRNKTLRKLDLMHTKISDAGIVYIAKGLEKNTALKCLKMTGISAVGGKALASAIATNASLPLVQLTLHGDDMITEDSRQAFIDMLQQNTSIETLYLSSTGMPRSDSVSDPVPFLAEALQNNSTLKQLYLFDYTLTPDMVKDVSRVLIVNCSLTLLDISENPIGDDGVTHLAEALKQNKTLVGLNISHCGITDAGVAPLAEALQINNSLRWLNVDGNNLTENGQTKLRELAAKKSNFRVSFSLITYSKF